MNSTEARLCGNGCESGPSLCLFIPIVSLGSPGAAPFLICADMESGKKDKETFLVVLTSTVLYMLEKIHYSMQLSLLWNTTIDVHIK